MPYLIKSEINGIQEFIFNIQSKGAAKALKARSFFIDAACILIEDIYFSLYKDSKKLFTGGGNVYLEINDAEWNEEQFKQTAQQIAHQLLPFQVTLSITFEHYDSNAIFGKLIQKLNQKLNREKLRFGYNQMVVFEPLPDKNKGQAVYVELSKAYSKNLSYRVDSNFSSQSTVLSNKSIQLLSKRLTLTESGESSLIPLPTWNEELLIKYSNIADKAQSEPEEEDKPKKGNIISFGHLAAFAKTRTGTDNIGVLKLDIDNLGKLFQQLAERKDNEYLSKAISHFFSTRVIDLLKIEIKTKTGSIIFKDNIYTVYAGGDDCFFIGAWDAVIEFALELQKQFSALESELRHKLTTFKHPLTLSAAIILVDPNFPVVRFADIVDEELKHAKGKRRTDKVDAAGEPMKNNISFMGHVFTWEEFHDLVNVKNVMSAIISEEKESRSFLQRIIQSFENSDTIYWHKCKPVKPFDPAILWRFLYSFRDVRHKSYFKAKYYDTFFSRTDGFYNRFLWKQFNPGNELSQVLPVAARWTELLTRNKPQ